METIKVKDLIRYKGQELLDELEKLLNYENIKFDSIKDYKEITVSLRTSKTIQTKDLLNKIISNNNYLPEGAEYMKVRCPICGNLTLKEKGRNIIHCTCCNILLSPTAKWEYEYAFNTDEITWGLLFDDCTVENKYSLEYLIKWLNDGIEISTTKPLVKYEYSFRDDYIENIITDDLSEYEKIEKTLGMIVVMSDDREIRNLAIEALSILKDIPNGTPHYLDINNVILADDIKKMKMNEGKKTMKRDDFIQLLRYKDMVNNLQIKAN